MIKAVFRAVLATCLIAPAFMLAPEAQAASISKTFLNGVLTITGTSAGDAMDIGCSSGNVTNNAGPLPGKQVKCARVTSLRLIGRGGDDNFSTSSIAANEFRKLRSVTLSGGSGSDSLSAPDVPSTLSGGSGDDYLSPGDRVDVLNGGAGFDDVSVNFDSKKFSATATQITHDGQTEPISSVELLSVFAGNKDNVINTTKFPGSSIVKGSNGNDTIRTGKGDDDIDGQLDDDQIFSGGGDDFIRVSAGNDSIDGQAGNNDVMFDSLGTGSYTLVDGSLTGPDGTAGFAGVELASLSGNTSGSITVDASGYSGPTYIRGGAGADSLTGGSGDDEIEGYAGDDNLIGGGGTDTLDVIDNGSGNHTITIGVASMTGLGSDFFSGFESAIVVTGSGDDTVSTSGSLLPATVWGGGGSDTLTGGSADDTLYGQDGDDTLTGNGGTNMLDGGAGTDTCNGTVPPDTKTDCEL